MNNYHLAIDIGASSGRHILGHVENGKIVLEEIYRFDNKQLHHNGHDCWDMDNLWNGILGGLKTCKTLGKIPATVGIDTWAVDFVLLDAAESLLMIPDYFNYRLTGVRKQEYTNATSTNLVNAQSKTWDMSLIATLGYPQRLFGELSMPGSVVGALTPEIQEIVGFQTTVILPATHDTGSAFLAVPAQDDNAVYLSSGTWSLLGVENEEPITSGESRLQNFTNEGGAWYRYRYLKNIMGLWMIQSIRRELNGVA